MLVILLLLQRYPGNINGNESEKMNRVISELVGVPLREPEKV